MLAVVSRRNFSTSMAQFNYLINGESLQSISLTHAWCQEKDIKDHVKFINAAEKV
jgi:hypothetical protein